MFVIYHGDHNMKRGLVVLGEKWSSSDDDEFL